MKLIRKMFADKKGATAIEYGLIAALIAVAAISAMNGLGNQLTKTFNNTSTAMSKAIAPNAGSLTAMARKSRTVFTTIRISTAPSCSMTAHC